MNVSIVCAHDPTEAVKARVIIIEDGAGNRIEWSRGSLDHCRGLAALLPKNGWNLFAILPLP